MSSATLSFEIEQREDIQLIHVSGPLDSITYDQFKTYLDPIVNCTNGRIVLDCSNLTYVNSRGVTLLVHYQRTTKLDFTFFGIAALRPRIVKSIRLLGLGNAVKWYPTLDDALHMAAAV
jgi:anti-sigma B factor antagonist